jgi:hypothetical protein
MTLFEVNNSCYNLEQLVAIEKTTNDQCKVYFSNNIIVLVDKPYRELVKFLDKKAGAKLLNVVDI